MINKPQSLRDANEKAFTAWFPQQTPEHIITSNAEMIKDFVKQHDAVILKPLDGVHSQGILLAKFDDPNLVMLIEMSTNNAKKTIIAQRYLPAIKTSGDYRIILINGKPLAFGLIRKTASNQIRAAISLGGGFEGFELQKHHYQLCDAISSTLVEKGLFCVGIDVIDNLITEINVTSPSLFRQIQNLTPVNVSKAFFDTLQNQIT